MTVQLVKLKNTVFFLFIFVYLIRLQLQINLIVSATSVRLNKVLRNYKDFKAIKRIKISWESGMAFHRTCEHDPQTVAILKEEKNKKISHIRVSAFVPCSLIPNFMTTKLRSRRKSLKSHQCKHWPTDSLKCQDNGSFYGIYVTLLFSGCCTLAWIIEGYNSTALFAHYSACKPTVIGL